MNLVKLPKKLHIAVLTLFIQIYLITMEIIAWQYQAPSVPINVPMSLLTSQIAMVRSSKPILFLCFYSPRHLGLTDLKQPSLLITIVMKKSNLQKCNLRPNVLGNSCFSI